MALATSLAPYVARVLNSFSELVEKPSGWLARCPCPGHGSDGEDSSPSVRITIGEGGKLLVKCRVGCPTSEILNQLNLSPKDLFPPPGELPMEPLVAAHGYELSQDDLAVRSKIYGELLAGLELVSQHRQSLLARGFTLEEIVRCGYRSLRTLDRTTLCSQLFARYRETLFEVPGFEEAVSGAAFLPTYLTGIVVPLRNLSGQVIALKTRRLEGNTRYYLWSTKTCPASNVCHVPAHNPELERGDTIRITEGEIKADLAFLRTKILTLSVPGVSSWKEVLPLVKQLDPRKVLVAFDWNDVKTKLGVCHAAHALVEELLQQGYEVGIEKWDNEKGIDDALKANCEIAVAWNATAIAELNYYLSQLLGEEDKSATEVCAPVPFPLETLPPSVAAFIQQTAEVLGCPPDYCAAGILATVSRALGCTRVVTLEGGWKETAHLFTCIVAPSASGKSPAIKRALNPIKKLQKKIFDAHMEQKEAHATYLRQCKAAKKGEGEFPEPVKPPEQLWHIWSADITREAVAGRLMANQLKHSRHDPALLIHRDEILGWVRSFNAYRGQGDDKEFWLSVFSGEDIKTDRKTNEETIVVDRPAVTVLGGIQPDLLAKIQPEGNTEDGFLPRFLFFFPSPPEAYTPSTATYNKELDKTWATIVRRLFALQPHASGRPKQVHLTEEATAAWIAWHQALAVQQKSPTFDNRLKVFFGKLRQHAARLLLNIHYLRYAAGEEVHPRRIDLDTLQRVQKLMTYFTSHYSRILWQMPLGPTERRIADFVRWVRLEHRGKVALRNIYRQKKFGTLGKRDATELCRLAEDRGFGVLTQEQDARNRPHQVFLLSETF